MNPARAALAAYPFLLVVAAAAAQADTAALAAVATHPRTPIHRAPADLVPSPGLWAAGADYKVGFAGGATFVPYLGESATENAVFRWRTLALGERDLAAGAEQREPRVQPFRCEYDLGGLTEVYDVLAAGLEQTFVLAAPPAGHGEVLLRGEVLGNLHGEARAPAHAPLAFADALGRHVVDYGAAFAIDADGARTPLATSLADGIIAIHLPRPLLATAAYPLTIDPMLSVVNIVSSTGPTTVTGGFRSLAVERDDHSPNHNVMIVYTRVASLLDVDVSALVCDDDFANPTTVFADLDPTVRSDDGDVTFVGGSDQWVLVLSRSVAAYTGCRYHLHAGGSTAFGTVLTSFVAPSSDRETRPRVGGSRRQFGGHSALLVRQRDPAGTPGNTAATSVWASVLDLTSGGESAPVLVAGGAFVDAENPAVSKDSGGESWVVAWQGWAGLLPIQWRVQARRIDQQGVLASATLGTDHATTGDHELAPRVDGSAGRYLLTFGTLDATAFPGKVSGDTFEVLHAMRFDWAEGAAAAAPVQPSHTVVGSLYREMRADGVSHDTDTRSHWAAVATNVATGQSYFNVLGYEGLLVYQNVLFPGTGLSASNALCFDDDHQHFQSVGTRTFSVTGGYQQTLSGVAWEYPFTGATIVGTGCSTAAIGAPARFQRGNEFAGVVLANAPSYVPALLIASWQTTNIPMDVFGMTGCSLYVDPGIGNNVTLGVLTDAIGRADVPLPLAQAIAATDVWFQWAHFAPGVNPAGIAFTAGMHAQIR